MAETVLIVGMGKTGQAAAQFFESRECQVICFDEQKPGYIECFNDIPFQELSFIVQSPGFPADHPICKKAKELGVAVFSDIDVFVKAAAGAQIIGITGTNGKSTTTALTHHILQFHFEDVIMGGNIGLPVLQLPIINHGIYVLELSSYQLELSHKLNLSIAALTNITEDHLARHKNMENYAHTKEKIFAGAGLAVVCCDDPYVRKICDVLEKKYEIREIFLKNNPILMENLRKMTTLPGDHNLQNIAIAVEIARCMGMSENEIATAVQSFKGLPHRLEYVAKKRLLSKPSESGNLAGEPERKSGVYSNVHEHLSTGSTNQKTDYEELRKKSRVLFINDSKATSAEPLIMALQSFPGASIFLIAGGMPKSDGIAPAIPHMGNVKEIFLIGAASERFAQELQDKKVSCFNSLPEATNAAFLAAKQAEGSPQQKIVLLSPACASFDQFANFEERGDLFKKTVHKLLSDSQIV